jgi:hypothetical protein
MKYFLDTEFIEYPNTIDLISIGIVAEDGREFYAISNEFDARKASVWVKENVISNLPPLNLSEYSSPNERSQSLLWKPCNLIKDRILEFIGSDTPEFWGYYADYDWVVFCWLFGTMMELPKGWPMYCRDLKQYLDSIGNPQLPKNENDNHNALEDARHLKKCFDLIYKT